MNVACSVGLTPSTTTVASVQTLVGNGPGQTTNGFDLQVRYSLPLGPGDFTADLTATYVTELTTGPTTLDGVQVSAGDDRLGFLNYATVASAAPELRANLALNYALDRHNIRVGVQYASAVTDERSSVDKPFYKNGEEWIVADLTYRFELDDSLAFTTTIGNIFDRDPPPAQEELGYDPRLGNPLGRTIEVGIKKIF